MAIYQTKDGSKTGFVPGVGEIVDGKIEGPDNLESPNLEKMTDQTQPSIDAPVVAPVLPEQPQTQPAIQTTNEETK